MVSEKLQAWVHAVCIILPADEDVTVFNWIGRCGNLVIVGEAGCWNNVAATLCLEENMEGVVHVSVTGSVGRLRLRTRIHHQETH